MRAPNTTSRMINVTGTEMNSALAKSSSYTWSRAAPIVESPTCSIRRSGCATAISSTTSLTSNAASSMAAARWSSVPEPSSRATWISKDVPSADGIGSSTSATPARLLSSLPSSATASPDAVASIAPPVVFCIRTDSVGTSPKSASSKARSAPADAPTVSSASSASCAVIEPPPTTAAATNAIQSNSAVHR